MQRQRHAGRGGIQQADGLIRQLPGGNVAVRKLYRRTYRLIQNQYVVVFFQRIHQTTHHFHCGDLFRFGNLQHLKTPGQRRIFLNMALVFAPGGGADSPQGAARQRRFQQVSGIARAGCAARAHQSVNFIDKQNNRLRRAPGLFQ